MACPTAGGVPSGRMAQTEECPKIVAEVYKVGSYPSRVEVSMSCRVVGRCNENLSRFFEEVGVTVSEIPL